MQTMLKKYGVKNVEPFNMDALTFPYYDDVKYILVDPSCSGSGKYFYNTISSYFYDFINLYLKFKCIKNVNKLLGIVIVCLLKNIKIRVFVLTNNNG